MFNTKDICNFIDGDFFENLKNISSKIKYLNIDDIDQFIQSKDLYNTDYTILLTHNGDKNIEKYMVEKVFFNTSIKHWYGQNINCSDINLTCIPIGLERIRWSSVFNKREVFREIVKQNNIIPNKLVYANFSLNTNNKKRELCYNKIKKIKNITLDVNNNVNINNELYYRNYYDKLLQHIFVICPEGNGIDTHRFWETLYLGRIPIVLSNYVNNSFKDLPIIILDNWDELDELSLIEYIKRFKNNEIYYSIDKLKPDYWTDLII